MPTKGLDAWFRRTVEEIEARKAEVERAGREAWSAGTQAVQQRIARPATPTKQYAWTQLPDRGQPPPPRYPPLNEGKSLAWPLPGRYELNRRNPAVKQGDGNFGLVRTYEDGRPKRHDGIDITAPVGARVTTAGAGRVVRAGHHDPGGYGNLVEVDHGGGSRTLYGHLDTITVKPGDQLLRGQSVGTVGRSGNVGKAEPHLHFGDGRKGAWRNPYTHLNETAYGKPWEEVRYLNPTEVSRLYGMD